jgi:hypothetical protein
LLTACKERAKRIADREQHNCEEWYSPFNPYWDPDGPPIVWR